MTKIELLEILRDESIHASLRVWAATNTESMRPILRQWQGRIARRALASAPLTDPRRGVLRYLDRGEDAPDDMARCTAQTFSTDIVAHFCAAFAGDAWASSISGADYTRRKSGSDNQIRHDGTIDGCHVVVYTWSGADAELELQVADLLELLGEES